MAGLGLFTIAFGMLLLTCCTTGLSHANPSHRLPGRLPEVRHPAGYMPLGSLGLVLLISGAMLLSGSTGGAAWLVAGVAGGVALAGPMVRHNHKLR